MEKYSGLIGVITFCAILTAVAYLFLQGLFLNLQIKRAPVYTNAKIVSYFPGTPNNLGEVSLTITYAFRAGDGVLYTNKNQALNIKTLDLDKFYEGKEIPIVYYKNNPKYNNLDFNNKNLRK